VLLVPLRVVISACFFLVDHVVFFGNDDGSILLVMSPVNTFTRVTTPAMAVQAG
jgi:hypothetical protein